MMENWHLVGPADELEDEDVMPFDLDGMTFAIYNTGGSYYATDGLCTHEDQHLSYGFVFDTVIECPLHQGRFDIPTGKALTTPVCIDLKTYAVKVEKGQIFINIPSLEDQK